MRRNQLAKLTEHTEFACGWFGISFFHLRRVTELKSHANHFFLCFNQDSYGMALKTGSFTIQGAFANELRLATIIQPKKSYLLESSLCLYFLYFLPCRKEPKTIGLVPGIR